MKISIIVPVYNEEKTILKILEKLTSLNLNLTKEIIIVNDGSIDQSEKIINKYIRSKSKIKSLQIKYISKKNGGKGSAIKKGIEHCTGDIITVQDADLEYNPQDYKKLIAPIIRKEALVVYGSRFLQSHKPMYKVYFMGNKFLTFLTKVLYNSKITDMETCYKVFKSDIIKKLDIKANHFDFEPEITARILKQGIKIKEIPISYSPRSIEEGKKINWKDGIQAIWTLIYWKFKKEVKLSLPN
ncbi:MAG: glycosyltransferase family 2 protein [Nanoarchaeota archaeon]|nr:glycosyltransferase family 2 protein [Nanoarchaeota archaeon]